MHMAFLVSGFHDSPLFHKLCHLMSIYSQLAEPEYFIITIDSISFKNQCSEGFAQQDRSQGFHFQV